MSEFSWCGGVRWHAEGVPDQLYCYWFYMWRILRTYRTDGPRLFLLYQDKKSLTHVVLMTTGLISPPAWPFSISTCWSRPSPMQPLFNVSSLSKLFILLLNLSSPFNCTDTHNGMVDESSGLKRFPPLVWHFGAFARTFESQYLKYFKENVLLIKCVNEYYEEIEPEF